MPWYLSIWVNWRLPSLGSGEISETMNEEQQIRLLLSGSNHMSGSVAPTLFRKRRYNRELNARFLLPLENVTPSVFKLFFITEKD